MKNHLLEARDEASEHHERILNYINKELDIIENLGYNESQRFFDQFSERAKDVILGVERGKENYYAGIEDFPQDVKEGSLVERVLYVSKVVDSLKEMSKSSKYNPAQGSFWESIGESLGKLASDIQGEVF
jgi:hypothetical protein